MRKKDDFDKRIHISQFEKGGDRTFIKYNRFYLLAIEEILLEALLDEFSVQKLVSPCKEAIDKMEQLSRKAKPSKRVKDAICKCFTHGKSQLYTHSSKLSGHVYGHSRLEYLELALGTCTHFISNEWNYYKKKGAQGVNFFGSYFQSLDVKYCIERDAKVITGYTSKTYEPKTFRYTYIYEAGIRRLTRHWALCIKGILRIMHNYQMKTPSYFYELVNELDQYNFKITNLQNLVQKISCYGSISYEDIFSTTSSLFDYYEHLILLWRKVVQFVKTKLMCISPLDEGTLELIVSHIDEGEALLSELGSGIHLCSFRLCGGTLLKGSLTYLRGIPIHNPLESYILH